MSLTYVGSCYGAQTLDPFLKALRILGKWQPMLADRIIIRAVGTISQQLKARMDSADKDALGPVCHVEHRHAIAEMARADVLILTTPDTRLGRYCIPAKTFEYLAFGGHILALVHPETQLLRILQAAGGVSITTDRRPEAIARILHDCYLRWESGRLSAARDCGFVARFRRDVLASRYSSVLDDCLKRRELNPACSRSYLMEASR